MTAPTLAEFLLARIAEDEVVARTAIEEYPVERYALYDDPTGLDTYCDRDYLEAMVRISPARVLAECEAKRRIVEVVAGWQHTTVEDCWYSCAATYDTDVENACCDDGREGMGCDCGLEYRARSILSPLAAVYADHPDFREEWRA